MKPQYPLTKKELLRTLDSSVCNYAHAINASRKYNEPEYFNFASGIMNAAAWFAAHLGIATPIWRKPAQKQEAA